MTKPKYLPGYLGTYERLNLHVSSSNVQVIRAARRKLLPKALTRSNRKVRHTFYRTMLHHHKEAGDLFRHYRF